jgi:L-ribulose-5-phosphate 3-epimerase
MDMNQTVTRRNFGINTALLTGAAVGAATLPCLATQPRLRIGVCDWNLKIKGRGAVEMVARIGLDGVQISPTSGAAETLSYATSAEQAEYRQAMKDTGMQIASVGLNIANQYPLATDPRAVSWLVQTVDAAAALGCTATLIAFFGKGDLRDTNTGGLKKAELDAVVGKLKEAAPHAKAKGVYLGLENTLSAKENMAIMDRVGSDHVQVYYDIANSSKDGYDVPNEIRMLKDRICEFHFKNSDGVFGEAGIDLHPIVEAVNSIDYKGWLVMERAMGKDIEGYFRKNAVYIRKLFQLS